MQQPTTPGSPVPPKKKRNMKQLQLSPQTAKPGAVVVTQTDSKGTFQITSQKLKPSEDSSSSAQTSISDPSSSCPSSAPSSASSVSQHKLSESMATLEIGIEFKLDLRIGEDLKVLEELGSGNGGTVSKALHIPTKRIMAKKVIHIDTKPPVRRQILRELHIMHECSSEYVVGFFGAFIQEPHISIVMEYMDKGSFDNVYRKNGPVLEPVLGKVAVAVCSGLTYLYEKHRIIHRDVKPSNILLNSAGAIKLCDFGVSGEAAFNSIVDTFVGTQIYMSPERLQGSKYSTRGDTWSLGITLVEIGLARFPFYTDEPPPESTLTPASEARRNSLRPARLGMPNGGLAPFEMMMLIVNEPSPRLPQESFSKNAVSFVDQCLQKQVDKRPTPKELMSSKWILTSSTELVDLGTWASSLV
ncbi:putative dual specificity protein kinase Fuz7 [Atractiella rhizophila]|nr:putative dual specificity protein kinase Fuz7 [Atractiella rhizophila]